MGHERIKMRDFLVELEANFGIVSTTCMKLNIGRRTYYNWIEKDLWFREACEKIRRIRKADFDDVAEHGLVKLILKGNPSATIFYLKTRHPEFMRRGPEEDNNMDNVDGEKRYGPLAEYIEKLNKDFNEEGFREGWENDDELDS